MSLDRCLQPSAPLILLWLVLQTWVGIGDAHAIQSPPQVVVASPDHGDNDVDPQLTTIRIEFDQEMSAAGYSICGGGPNFPQVVGKPSWVNAKVLEMQVKLQPEHDYNLSINCESAQQCRSQKGQPAVPYPLSFRTRAAGAPANPLLTVEQQTAVMDRLSELVRDRYSYRDLRNVNWKEVWQTNREKISQPMSAPALARQLAKALRAANDPHIAVKLNSFGLSATAGPYPVSNFNGRSVAGIVKDLVNHNRCVATARVGDDIGYLLITTWADGAESIRPAIDFLKNADRWRAIIIDVRPNGGGDEMLARKVAAHFVSEQVIYAKHRFVDPQQSNGFGQWQSRALEPIAGQKPFGGPVAVLMGPTNMSSNEAFLLMMRQCRQARLIGGKSLGSSGNPQPHELGHGISVMLPSWQSAFPDETLLEGRGIEPDQSISTSPADLAKHDAILAAAIEWIGE